MMHPNSIGIRAFIRKDENGKHVTQVWKNEKIAYEMPTPKSQIRPERESCLYKPGTTQILKIAQNHNNLNVRMYEDLEVEES